MGANSTCPAHELKPANNATIINDGAVTLQIHQVGFIVSGACAFFATVVSAWLVARHLSFYTNRKIQRHIVRILFLVPIYACGSWLSYFFWTSALYFQLARDCYEAVRRVKDVHD